MTNQSNKPVDAIRDGAIKASIWRNPSEKGPFYSVTFTRTFTDAEGKFRDADSFGGSDLLKLSHLAGKAYDRIGELRSNDKATSQEAA